MISCWLSCQSTTNVVLGRDTGAPRAERGPGASSNMTDFRFCELQNRRRKCRIFVRIIMWSQKKGLQASHADFSVSYRWAPLELNGHWSQRPSWSPWAPGSLYLPASPSWWPWREILISKLRTTLDIGNEVKKLSIFSLIYTEQIFSYNFLLHPGRFCKHTAEIISNFLLTAQNFRLFTDKCAKNRNTERVAQ